MSVKKQSSGTPQRCVFVRDGLQELGRSFRSIPLRLRLRRIRQSKINAFEMLGAAVVATGRTRWINAPLADAIEALKADESTTTHRKRELEGELQRIADAHRHMVAEFDQRHALLVSDKTAVEARRRTLDKSTPEQASLQARLSELNRQIDNLAKERATAQAALDQERREKGRELKRSEEDMRRFKQRRATLLVDLGRVAAAADLSDPAAIAARTELAAIEADETALHQALDTLNAATNEMPPGTMIRFSALGAAIVLIIALGTIATAMLWRDADSRLVTAPPPLQGTETTYAAEKAAVSMAYADHLEVFRKKGPRAPEGRRGSVTQAADDLLRQEQGSALLHKSLSSTHAEEQANASAVLGWASDTHMPTGKAAERAIALLIPQLADEHWRTRANAAVALGRLGQGHAPTANALAGIMDDSNPRVRAAATFALSEAMGSDPRLPDMIAPRLQDDFPDVRVVAANALAFRGHADAVPSLFLLCADRHSAVRNAAYRALQTLGSQAVAALPHLIDAAMNDRNQSRAAIEALVTIFGDLGDTAPGHDVRHAVLERIDALVHILSIAPLATHRRGLAASLVRVTGWLSPQEQNILVDPYARAYPDRGPEFVLPLIALSRIVAPEELLRLLQERGARQAGRVDRGNVPMLLRQLEHDDPSVRWAAASLLGRARIKTVVPALAKAMDDPDAPVALAAARSLADIGMAALPAAMARIEEDSPKAVIMGSYILARLWGAVLSQRLAGIQPRLWGEDGDADAVADRLLALVTDFDRPFAVRQAAYCAFENLKGDAPRDPELLLSGLPGRPTPLAQEFKPWP